MTDDLVEKVARIICGMGIADGCACQWCGSSDGECRDPEEALETWGEEARAAIAACRDDLMNEGAAEAYGAVSRLLASGTPVDAVMVICNDNVRILRGTPRERANQIANQNATSPEAET